MGKTEEKKYCVYKLTSPEGKIYIGMSSNIKRRWQSKGRGYASGNQWTPKIYQMI